MPRRSTRSLAVIESIMRASEQEFERFVTSHIGPLAQRHGASIIREDGPILQSAEFSAGPVCVRFNNDRGLLSLDVSPTHVLRFWAVEEIARLLTDKFPSRFSRWQQALSFAAIISKENSQ